MGINTDIAENIIEQQISAIQFEQSIVQDVRRLVIQIENEIEAALKDVDPTEPNRLTFRQRRQLRFRDEFLEPLVQNGYQGIQAFVETESVEAATVFAEGTAAAINEALGVRLVSTGVSAELLRATVANTLIPRSGGPEISSATIREWWQRQATTLQQSVFDQVNSGVVQGEDLNTILRRVRGTRENRFKDGIIDGVTKRARRDAKALVRTYSNGVLNESSNAVFEANDDIITAVQTLTTLDGRTTPICIARTGERYSLPGYTPLGPRGIAWLGGPPWHFQCRSRTTPVLASFEDLVGARGRVFDDTLATIGPGTRSSIDGEVPASMTFDQFLRRREERRPGFADQQLGKGAADLWRSNQLSLGDLIDAATGEPLTLIELRARAGA